MYGLKRLGAPSIGATMKRVINLRRAVVLLVFLSLLLYLVSSMPLLYYDIGIAERPCKEAEAVDLDGLTVFVVDLHVSAGQRYSERFHGLAEYVKTESVSNLVVLGDLFGWRSDYDSIATQLRDRKEVIKTVLDLLGLLDQRLTVYLILGDTSHDPQDLDVNVEFGKTRFVSVGKCAIFRMGGLRIIGLHGDQAFGGPFGFAVSIFTRNLFLERMWKERMDISPDTWVIMAHTHVPGIDRAARVANTGGWTEIPIVRASRGMGIAVDERANVNLITF